MQQLSSSPQTMELIYLSVLQSVLGSSASSSWFCFFRFFAFFSLLFAIQVGVPTLPLNVNTVTSTYGPREKEEVEAKSKDPECGLKCW